MSEDASLPYPALLVSRVYQWDFLTKEHSRTGYGNLVLPFAADARHTRWQEVFSRVLN